MSKKDALLLASRAVALFLTVAALSEMSYVPEFVNSFLHYHKYAPTASTNVDYLDYMRHYYLIRLAFLLTRIVGLSLLARWIYKGGSEIEELLMPSAEATGITN
jgi:hypothetical protein